VIFFILLLLVVSGEAATLNAESKQLLQQGRYEEAFPLLEQAALLGNGDARYNLGISYLEGLETDQNEEKALE